MRDFRGEWETAAADHGVRGFENALRRLALLLQRAIGHAPPADPGIPPTVAPGHVVVPIWEPELGEQAALLALELLVAALAPGGSSSAGVRLDAFFARAQATNFIEIEMRLIRAAERRGIPWARLVPGRRLVRFGQGAWQAHVHHTFSPATGQIATGLATHKDMGAALLRGQGLPVPPNVRVRSSDEAVRAAVAIGLPVVVKPATTDHGVGVSLGNRDADDVRQAYATAALHGDVIVESEIAGVNHRLLVMYGRLVSAVRQDRAHVVGDGHQTVVALIHGVNADRTDELTSRFRRIEIDDEARLLLARQGLTLESVPAAGRTVALRHGSNNSRGGTITNVTPLVHPDNAAVAVRAAAVVGLDVAGIDFVTTDIARSFREVGGGICEVNPTPGFYMMEPEFRIEDAFLDGWFPAGERGRVPVVCVVAEDDDVPAPALSAVVTGLQGRVPGLAVVAPEGVRVDDWWIGRFRHPAREGTRTVLADPHTRAAVVQMDLRTIAGHGLGVDGCALAVVGATPPAAARPFLDGMRREQVVAWLAARAGECVDPADPDRLTVALDRVVAAALRAVPRGRGV
ncbi:MAG: hypothetical protein IT561_00935 [Alphaproteobacteria bacterium]|nr:hypothetical protein [Alphaproteobacteria bacterium]